MKWKRFLHHKIGIISENLSIAREFMEADSPQDSLEFYERSLEMFENAVERFKIAQQSTETSPHDIYKIAIQNHHKNHLQYALALMRKATLIDMDRKAIQKRIEDQYDPKTGTLIEDMIIPDEEKQEMFKNIENKF